MYKLILKGNTIEWLGDTEYDGITRNTTDYIMELFTPLGAIYSALDYGAAIGYYTNNEISYQQFLDVSDFKLQRVHYPITITYNGNTYNIAGVSGATYGITI